ncbi:hypothetical protein Ae201684_002378 [Aphanomyces euteiches]|uniref:Uncharacterized protein n=1 Tax=Aphanomyces euteiches TaxID=100861 RepID=A0A6G0XQ67_9STRA|nr:hypothetical protein Ae201684_002378 [Aphanomyces euteiches]
MLICRIGQAVYRRDMRCTVLSAILKPNFFVRLMEIAKRMKDDSLKDVAFEGRIRYSKYDNVHEEARPIQWNGPLYVECKWDNSQNCTPSTTLCDAIDAVVRLRFSDNVIRFCLLKLTTATTHTLNEEMIWDFAKPFVAKRRKVCYMALLPDAETKTNFQLFPAQWTKQQLLTHFPLYIYRGART